MNWNSPKFDANLNYTLPSIEFPKGCNFKKLLNSQAQSSVVVII